MKQIRATGRHLPRHASRSAFSQAAPRTRSSTCSRSARRCSAAGSSRRRHAGRRRAIAAGLCRCEPAGADRPVVARVGDGPDRCGRAGAAGRQPARRRQCADAGRAVADGRRAAIGIAGARLVLRERRCDARPDRQAGIQQRPRVARAAHAVFATAVGAGNLGSTSAASLLQSGLNPQNMQAASYIAQSAPGQLQSLATTLSQAVQFATSQGISVPSVASSALKLLP